MDRRLRHFGIYYTDHNIDVEDVQQAVAKELDGLGKQLGTVQCTKKFVRYITSMFLESL